MAYSDKVVDHYENPRNVGSFDKNDTDVGTGMVGAPACGDVMKLQIRVQDGVITDARFKTYGCGSAIASSSLLLNGSKDAHLTRRQRLKIAKLLMSLPSPLLRFTVQYLQKMQSRRR
jgi:nitrogen fixation NifU-like protein